MLEIFDQTPLAKGFKKCLPKRISHRSVGSYYLALMVVAGHIHGVDALSDLSEIQDDPYIRELFKDDVSAVRTIGDFLRDFEDEHIEKLNAFLNQMSRSLFLSLQTNLKEPYKPKDLLIDMDSTYHEHFGEKIDGVGWKKQLEREGMDWKPWVHSEASRKYAGDRGLELPKIKVARFFWGPGGPMKSSCSRLW